MKDKIILLDLNYTLVSNQPTTKHLYPFTARLAAEQYRQGRYEYSHETAAMKPP